MVSTYPYPPNGQAVTETDNGTDFPIDATATFTFSNNQVIVTLTNTTGTWSNPFYDSQNLSGISFQIYNNGTLLSAGCGSSGYSAGASYCTENSSISATNSAGTGNAQVVNSGGVAGSGATHPGISTVNPLGTSSVPNPVTNVAVSWGLFNIGTAGSFGSGTVAGGSGNVAAGADAFVLAISGSSAWNGTNSIVSAPDGTKYTNKNPVGTCPVSGSPATPNCNSGQPIAGNYYQNGTLVNYQATEQMIYSTATFTFNITGVTANSYVNNVYFIFGPDGPDEDDWAASSPEPSSYILGGTGILVIVFLRLWRNRARFATANPVSVEMAASMKADSEVAVDGGMLSGSSTGSLRARLKRARFLWRGSGGP